LPAGTATISTTTIPSIYQEGIDMHQLEFDLNFDSPESNPNGLHVLLAKDINPNGKELMDKVMIIKALYNPK
jgi:hypothetical protein